jgi:hypothetical protein
MVYLLLYLLRLLVPGSPPLPTLTGPLGPFPDRADDTPAGSRGLPRGTPVRLHKLSCVPSSVSWREYG